MNIKERTTQELIQDIILKAQQLKHEVDLGQSTLLTSGPRILAEIRNYTWRAENSIQDDWDRKLQKGAS